MLLFLVLNGLSYTPLVHRHTTDVHLYTQSLARPSYFSLNRKAPGYVQSSFYSERARSFSKVIDYLDSMYDCRLDFPPFWDRSPVVYPPPTNVVWSKERGLTKRLEIEPQKLIVVGKHVARKRQEHTMSSPLLFD